MHAPTPISIKRRLVLPVMGEASRKADEDHMAESVYERIKTWLLSQALVPGQVLQIGVLAEQLGVSTTPVREALTRLAAERIIISAPKRGFFARTPSDEEIRGLYYVNQTVIDSAAARLHVNVTRGDVPVDLADPLPVSAAPSAEHIAARTATLFITIAAASRIEEFAAIARNMNDRLHHARRVECELIEGAGQELAELSWLFDANKVVELRAGLERYHARRVQLVPSISKELLLKSFLSRR